MHQKIMHLLLDKTFWKKYKSYPASFASIIKWFSSRENILEDMDACYAVVLFSSKCCNCYIMLLWLWIPSLFNEGNMCSAICMLHHLLIMRDGARHPSAVLLCLRLNFLDIHTLLFWNLWLFIPVFVWYSRSFENKS